jgi:SAM-dependent methyltransferase
MSSTDSRCNVCEAGALFELAEYRDLPRVTSDCKPFASGGRLAVCMACGAVQKPIDDRWRGEIDAIYRNYEPYFQSGGVEQAVFDASKGRPMRRSDMVLDKLASVRSLASRGAIVDVGCGNGVLLKAFAAIRPDWRRFGHELSALHERELMAIPGFEKLFTGDLNAMPGDFDLITMMHALEHFIDPLQALRDLKNKLAPGGTLFIEVPDVAATPFDLLIADHVSHFTRHHLANILERSGMGVLAVADDWITKELSAVATPTGASAALPPGPPPQAVLERVKSQIVWLEAIMDGARHEANGPRKFGLFGSSVAAMWLLGQLGDEVEFFVDEDPSREGATLLGRPVYTPAQMPHGSAAYLALIPRVARAVAGRLGRPGVEFCIPPEMAA